MSVQLSRGVYPSVWEQEIMNVYLIKHGILCKIRPPVLLFILANYSLSLYLTQHYLKQCNYFFFLHHRGSEPKFHSGLHPCHVSHHLESSAMWAEGLFVSFSWPNDSRALQCLLKPANNIWCAVSLTSRTHGFRNLHAWLYTLLKSIVMLQVQEEVRWTLRLPSQGFLIFKRKMFHLRIKMMSLENLKL